VRKVEAKVEVEFGADIFFVLALTSTLAFCD